MSERVPPVAYPAAIEAAQQRLLALRCAAGVQARAQALPADDDIASHAPRSSLVERLPAHLGWESAAFTRALRRTIRSQQQHKQPAAAETPQPAVPTADAQPPHPTTERAPDATLFPDVALAMLRSGSVATGRVWLLLRHLDPQGRGWFNLQQVRKLLTDEKSRWRICGRRHLRNLLARGEGLFWQLSSDRLWLRSVARVAAALGIERLTRRSVSLPAHLLIAPIGELRAHLYASFHSSRRAKPISRATLSRLTTVSGRTQRNYERRADVQRVSNYAVGASSWSSDLQASAWQHGQALFELRDKQGIHGRPGTTLLAWQLPNSFSGPHNCGPRTGMKRINRRLAVLLNQGTTGNGQPEIEEHANTVSKRYFAHASAAARAVSREVSRRSYWAAHQSSLQAPSHCAFWYTLGGD